MKWFLALLAALTVAACGKAPENTPLLRGQITSALRKAALNHEEAKKTWPKSLEEIKGDPAVQSLPGGVLDKVKFDLKEAKPDGDAVFVFEYEGATREIPLRPRSKNSAEPSAAGM
ncbi:MAG: hypothetical protein HONBIEJF_02212 [Fimbriimonadaceae bacterium]|nr:hypothetical protein [Fimbriimonadaceae bacterium]